ncbi:ecto-ADP-ribosyltransferase 5-like [Lissotriton helveticus]
MALNSFDDQYIGCADKMEHTITSDRLLEKELSINSKLKKQWDSAKQKWVEKKNSGLLPDLPKGFKDEYGVALLAYTAEDGGIYKDFNTAVREGGRSTVYYMNNFHFKSLHFYLTRAFQLLREDCKIQAKEVYRGVDLQHEPTKGSEMTMRFGQITSSSLDKEQEEGLEADSFFTIRTCFGVLLKNLDNDASESVVLIPANEVFNVTQYTDTEQGRRFLLNSTQKTCSYNNCAYFNGKDAKSSVPNCIYNSAPGGDNKFPLPLLFSGFLMIRARVLMIFSIN